MTSAGRLDGEPVAERGDQLRSLDEAITLRLWMFSLSDCEKLSIAELSAIAVSVSLSSTGFGAFFSFVAPSDM